MKNIYLVSYFNMAGDYKAVVIADDGKEAIDLFDRYFGDDIDAKHTEAQLVGGNAKGVSRVILGREYNP